MREVHNKFKWRMAERFQS